MNEHLSVSEKEIVDGCINNDRYYQELLYKRFFPTMYSLCLRYAKEESKALEILNAAFLRVFKKLDTFQFKGSLEGWVRKLIYHAISDYFKKENRRPTVISINDNVLNKPSNLSALDPLYMQDLLQLVEHLSPLTKKVFQLYAIEGFSHAEIAETLGMSVGTSKWHLSNARKKLKYLISKDKELGRYAG